MVLAPHADDETLGAGALIAEMAEEGRLAGVVYLTDGSGSHPPSSVSRARLVTVRRSEARLAVRRLSCGTAPPPLFLDWQDAHPFAADNRGFHRSVRRLAALLRSRRVDALAVTARAEPHCDHSAAHALAVAAIAVARRPVALFVYHVWSAPPAGARRAYRTRAMPPGRRRHALQAHASQLGTRLGPGFRLARGAWRMPVTDTLYREIRHGG